MDVIVPQFVADEDFSTSTTELLSSTIAESSSPEWDVGTTYAINDTVLVQPPAGSENAGIWIEYKSLQNSNTGNDPLSEPTWWVSLGSTNRWKMFDVMALTTTLDGSSDIVVNLHCRSINSIAFMNTQADGIDIKVYSGSELADKTPGNLILETSMPLTQYINDWFEWFFDDFDYIRDVSTPLDIYLYHNTVIEITFNKISGEDCYVGQCVPGRLYNLGRLQYGVATRIKDYSIKTTDEVFGYTYLQQGNYVKGFSGDLIIETEKTNEVNMVLTQLRATPTVWQGNPEDTEFDNLLIWGFYQNFEIVMNHGAYAECNIELEGLI